jgi:hypothetical protein
LVDWWSVAGGGAQRVQGGGDDRGGLGIQPASHPDQAGAGVGQRQTPPPIRPLGIPTQPFSLGPLRRLRVDMGQDPPTQLA